MPLGSLMRIGTGNFSKTDLVRYSLEFVIVFGGVYLAFLLTDYQEELRKGEVRLKYYDSLIHEFESLKGHLGNEERKLVKHAAVLEEIEQGKRPPIPVSDLSFLSSAVGSSTRLSEARTLPRSIHGYSRTLLEGDHSWKRSNSASTC